MKNCPFVFHSKTGLTAPVAGFVVLACVWIFYFRNAFLLECILENTFSKMHFAENSVFGKILKLFIRSDYAERNYVWLVF